MHLDGEEKHLLCAGPRTHSYDRARSGYFNLTSPGDGEGDGKDAVRARTRFLSGGDYEPLCNAVCDILRQHGAKTVLDAGCGEGYYTNRMAQDLCAVGVDLSRAGIDAAAKVAKQTKTNALFCVASLFTLPVRDASVDAVTNLFAPCAEQEFLRVLKSDGILVLVGAGERHLFGLKERIYEHPYLNPGRADLPVQIPLLEHRRLSYTVTVRGKESIEALFSMTPYYWRTSESDRAKLDACEELETEVDFDIYIYKKGE